MKPAPFGYHRAATVADAVRMLAAYDGTARVIAGGQSLVPMLNMRLARPDALIDVAAIPALADITVDGGALRIGAMVRYSTLETSAIVASHAPLISRMVRHVGDRQVRNRGTIGGSLAQADPTGEMPLACLTLGATVRVAGEQGERDVELTDLYETSYATRLEPTDVITQVRIPPAPRAIAFAEYCRRHNDFAVISVAATGNRNADGTWTQLRIGLGGVADTPVLAEPAMRMLEGTRLDEDAVAEAAQATLGVIDPPTDIRASAEYRRHLTPIYLRRVIGRLATGS